MNNNMRCPNCQGYGLIKIENPVKCPCKFAFCYKCENNEGYLVNPWQECSKCDGLGSILNSDLRPLKINKSDTTPLKINKSYTTPLKINKE